MTVQHALELVEIGLTYEGERVTDGDLPDDVDDLLALSQTLARVQRVAEQVRREVDEAAAALIGPGRPYRYGDHVVAWRHGYKYQAYPAAGKFVVDVARHDPEWVLDLFNPNYMRKTGIEKVAKRMGLDPAMVVQTVLSKTWEDSPRLHWKWQPDEGEQHDQDR